jgi:hypothetical protein
MTEYYENNEEMRPSFASKFLWQCGLSSSLPILIELKLLS